MDTAMSSLLVQQSPDALVALDAAGTIRSWNLAAERIFGFLTDEALDRRLVELLLDAAQRPAGDAALRDAAAGAAVHCELVCRRRDTAMLYVTLGVRAQHDESGTVLGFFCTLSDVTPARLARDREFVRQRFGAVLESVPDAMVVVNDTGRIVLINAQASTMFGHAAEAVIGGPVEQLLPERLRAQHMPQRSQFLDAPRVRPMGPGLTLYGLRADGAEFPVEISLSPIETEGQRFVMSAIRDITDRKRIERALQEKNLELERANRAKDHFLATMSHELRTPMNAILGFTGLLLMKLSGPLSEKQERQLGLVHSSGKHLLSLINDLLDLAKIESGRVELLREPVEIGSVVDEVVTALRPQAQTKDVELDACVPGLPTLVLADRRALHQVLLNLTGNAIKFTAHGKVCIDVSLGQGEQRPEVRFAVSDTGVGIAPEDVERLFQAFVQVGDFRDRTIEGTGLGLHLSRKLAGLMHGRLEVASELGHGSTFTLTLEAAAA